MSKAITSNLEITGLTISGGEPFMQASKINTLLDLVKLERPDIDIIIYTGFQINQLDWPEAKQLLQKIDVLIDGKYVQSMDNRLGLRGSTNQNIFFLTDKLEKHKSDFISGNRSQEIVVHNNYIQHIGLPDNSLKIKP
jgi:anaerobic ribonucleoside-triphosphate reductase activating protein